MTVIISIEDGHSFSLDRIKDDSLEWQRHDSWEIMSPSQQQMLLTSSDIRNQLQLNNVIKLNANGQWLILDSVEDGFIPSRRLPAPTVSLNGRRTRLDSDEDSLEIHDDSVEDLRRWGSLLPNKRFNPWH